MTPVAEARALLADAVGERLRTGFPMAPLTSFRLGGPAALFLEVRDDADLDAVADAVRATGVAVVTIGKGSNVLVADAGFDGLVLRLGRGFRWIARDGDVLRAGAATPLPTLAGEALRHGLEGLSFLVAIPASVGGGVRMNAGAHGDDVAATCAAAAGVVLGTGEHRAWSPPELGFSYRSSALPPDAVVTEASFALRPGDRVGIRAAMDEARRWRRETQPIAEPNCGSVFTNPPGDHAARLIDEAGLKGTMVGGAEVSPKHANFIVAHPGATAADVSALIDRVRDRVAERSGVTLVPEVRRIGAVDGA